MPEPIQTQFKAEGDPAFPTENKENDNSAASSTGEKMDANQTQSPEGESNTGVNKKDDGIGDDNLADHPRWKEREADWDKRFNEQETRHVGEITKLREEFEQRFNSKNQIGEEGAPTEVPAWFGGDESQWKEFVKWNTTLFNKAKSEALNEIQSKSAEEQKRIDEATNYFTDQVKSIESDKSINPKGEKIDRNKLLKFVLDNDLVDSKGRWNYRAGFLLIKAGVAQVNSTSTDEKKRIANASTSDKHAESKPSPFMTSEDFQKPGARPW
jgi:hypothetical protein